jgi:hypothetical protein
MALFHPFILPHKSLPRRMRRNQAKSVLNERPTRLDPRPHRST